MINGTHVALNETAKKAIDSQLPPADHSVAAQSGCASKQRRRFELRGQKIYDGSALFHTEKQYYNSNGSTLGVGCISQGAGGAFHWRLNETQNFRTTPGSSFNYLGGGQFSRGCFPTFPSLGGGLFWY
jgi:hypothetical protein